MLRWVVLPRISGGTAEGQQLQGHLAQPAVWAIGCYRMGNWLNVSPPNVLVRVPLKAVSLVLNKMCEVVMEMCIGPNGYDWEGLFIAHIGGVHINPEATLGKNCDIAHRVTIGTSAMGRKGAPVLGDDVYVGTGASIVGKIRVGSRAKIAANTLVMTNVPEGATVMGGVPGRIVMREAPAAAVVPVETVDAANA